MEFWGVEVKPGETVKCDPGEDKYLHLSQASLGETKKDKGNENVPIFVKFNDQKLVLGTLSMEKSAQISFDLVFEKEFELSHSSKNASVYFCGYKTIIMDDNELDDFAGSDSEEEDIKLSAKENGKPGGKVEVANATATKKNVANAGVMATKPKIKIDELENADKKDNEDDEEDDEEDDDEEDEEVESDDDEDMVEAEDDSDEDEDGSSDEDDEEVTPEKAEPGKKRPFGSASKTPAPEKKAKLVSPVGSQKTGGDGKKAVHIATPYPAKQVVKTPANGNNAKQQQTPKSGTVSCMSCSKTFNSENALQAHSKAKHSIGK